MSGVKSVKFLTYKKLTQREKCKQLEGGGQKESKHWESPRKTDEKITKMFQVDCEWGLQFF